MLLALLKKILTQKLLPYQRTYIPKVAEDESEETAKSDNQTDDQTDDQNDNQTDDQTDDQTDALQDNLMTTVVKLPTGSVQLQKNIPIIQHTYSTLQSPSIIGGHIVKLDLQYQPQLMQMLTTCQSQGGLET